MRKEWEALKSLKASKTSAVAYYSNRSGMFGSAGPEQYVQGNKYRCYACQELFADRADVATHPCSDETEFREHVGRPIITNPRANKARGPYKKRQPKQPDSSVVEWKDLPEEWVRWNANLLNQIDAMNNRNASLNNANDELAKTISKQNAEIANLKAEAEHHKAERAKSQTAHVNEAQRLAFANR